MTGGPVANPVVSVTLSTLSVSRSSSRKSRGHGKHAFQFQESMVRKFTWDVCLHNAEVTEPESVAVSLINHGEINKQAETIKFSTLRSSKNSCNKSASALIWPKKKTLMALGISHYTGPGRKNIKPLIKLINRNYTSP